MTWLLVFTGGGVGAVARMAVAKLLPATGGGFPWGTFVANFLACTILGMGLSLVGRQQLAPPQQLLLITGFCGGFSTFSTFSAELLLMLQEGQPFLAFLYLATSVLVGVLSIFAVVYFTGGPTIS